MTNPFGPLSAEEFKSLVNAPHGQAADAIRKFDPLFGKNSGGETRPWRVKLVQEVRMSGYVTVEAATEDDACILAEAIPEGKISWDFEDSDLPYIVEAKPR